MERLERTLRDLVSTDYSDCFWSQFPANTCTRGWYSCKGHVYTKNIDTRATLFAKFILFQSCLPVAFDACNSDHFSSSSVKNSLISETRPWVPVLTKTLPNEKCRLVFIHNVSELYSDKTPQFLSNYIPYRSSPIGYCIALWLSLRTFGMDSRGHFVQQEHARVRAWYRVPR